MNHSASTTRLLLLIAALTNPFCWLPFISAARSAPADVKTGDVQGSVYTVGSDGSRSVVAGANVTLNGPSLSIKTVTNERGNYSFTAIVPGAYRIEVKAPGLLGASAVTVISGTALDVLIQLKIEAVKQTVTVKGSDEPAISTESSGQTAINRSTVLNAPNKYDRFDSLLPLIPGVVRGPDGLINMKGARASQGGSLVNSASVTDPATGNPAINLPIDVVESVKVIDDPYDPEYR
jgi:carboxypeptidase family protein